MEEIGKNCAQRSIILEIKRINWNPPHPSSFFVANLHGDFGCFISSNELEQNGAKIYLIFDNFGWELSSNLLNPLI